MRTEVSSPNPAVDRETRWRSWWFFTLMVLAHAALMWRQPTYPMVDLPFHLAAATIHEQLRYPEGPFHQVFEPRTGLQPNLLHLAWCRMPFLSVETANRLYLMGYVVLFGVSLGLVVSRLKGEPTAAAMGLLFLYDFNFSWGFVNFIMSVPLVILGLCGWSKWLVRPRLWQGVGLALMSAGLFFVHLLGLLFWMLVACATALAMGKRTVKRVGLSLLPLIPAVLLVMYWSWQYVDSQGLGTWPFLWKYYTEEYAASWAVRPYMLVWQNGHLFGAPPWLAFVTSLALLACACLPFGEVVQDRFQTFRRKWKEPLFRALVILIGCALGCALLLPGRIPGQWYLFERFPIWMASGLVCLGSALRPRPRWAWLNGVLACFCILHFLLYANYFGGFNEQMKPLREMVLAKAQGRLGGFIYRPDYRGHPVFRHVANYHAVWNKGLATTPLPDFRFGSLKRIDGFKVLPATLISTGDEQTERFYDLNGWVTRRVQLGMHPQRFRRIFEMESLLVRGRIHDHHQRFFERFAVESQSGSWRLFKKKPPPRNDLPPWPEEREATQD